MLISKGAAIANHGRNRLAHTDPERVIAASDSMLNLRGSLQ
jgi:hypothetical protein